MFLRLSPGENALGWNRAHCDAELEAIAADLRARIGLEPELQDLGAPDPVVILPEGFTSVYDTTNPDFGPAGGYTPPIPTIYLPANTDPATIAQHRNTTPTVTPPATEPQEHTITTPILNDADITPYWEAVEHHLGDQAPEILNPPATDE
ncbi:hypothetical protein, partial [Kocuria sp. ZOR0020]|uniref:hypothetical protein n=1 Tax=Kocuria sp. ZOR0020 TaxID=1339234 RepID=UPI003510C3AD